ncbi:MAG: hypothetical protein ABGX83_05200 [Nitrospira sp.]
MARYEELAVTNLLDGNGNKILGPQAATVAAVAGAIPAGGTGAAAGGFDTSGNRDIFIATVTENKTQLNLILAALKAHGLIAS